MEIADTGRVRQLMKSETPVIIFFHLSGCGHCEAMRQPYLELQKEMPNMKFYLVESEFVPPELGISGFPEFRKFRNGKQIGTASGEMPKEELKKKLLSGGRRKSTRRRGSRRLTRRRR